jgi:hypothetical protein
LTPSERSTVRANLAQVLDTKDSIRGYVQRVFTVNARIVLRRLPPGVSTAVEHAEAVVSLCLERGWRETPSLLEQLLTDLIDLEGIGALQVLLERVQEETDPNPDPFDARWIFDTRPFWGREKLRDNARKLLEHNTRPILRVIGPPGSGLSFTGDFFDHMRDQPGTEIRVARAELPKDSAPAYEVTELADALVSPMQPSEPMPQRATSSYAATLCRWILRSAMRQPGRWVLVLDGYGQRDVKKEVLDLIQVLAQEVTGGEYRQRIRLVLIDDEDGATRTPTLRSAEILDEELSPAAALASKELLECLAAHNVRQNLRGGIQIDPDEFGAIVADILANVPADGKARLEQVSEQLQATVTN